MPTSTSHVRIEAPRETVWAVVTQPGYIKQWQYGGDLDTDRSVGSPIRFRAEWDGQVFEQWVTVLKVDAPHRLQYSLFAQDDSFPDRSFCYGDVMSRTREFDPDVALRQAMELFWDRGYAATSMADLVEHLGVARAGIYSVFGSKRELYLKALQRYSNDKDPVLVGLLGRPGSALGNVRDLVEIYAAEVVGDERRRGCLMVNSAVELSARDAAVTALIGRSWEVLEAALTSALVRAKQDGELSPEKDPQALARLLVVVLQGLRVLGRAEPRPSLVRDAVDQVSAALS